jgi:hypothetical protein
MELKLYTISDLTTILNLHPKTILRFIHEGKITVPYPTVRFGWVMYKILLTASAFIVWTFPVNPD